MIFKHIQFLTPPKIYKKTFYVVELNYHAMHHIYSQVSFMNLSRSVKKRSTWAPSDEIPETNMQRNTLFVYVHVCVSKCVRTRVCVCECVYFSV